MDEKDAHFPAGGTRTKCGSLGRKSQPGLGFSCAGNWGVKHDPGRLCYRSWMHVLELGLSVSGRAGSDRPILYTAGDKACNIWWGYIINAFNYPTSAIQLWKGRGGQGERKIIYTVQANSCIIPFTVAIPIESVR